MVLGLLGLMLGVQMSVQKSQKELDKSIYREDQIAELKQSISTGQYARGCCNPED